MRPTATSVIVLLNPAECAKGIVDFMRHKACFCDYFCLFSEHCIISVKYAFLLMTNLLTLMSIISFAPFQLGFDSL